MNGNERDEIRALTKQLVVPRAEIDRRETNLRDRIGAGEHRAMRWAISLGALNLGGWASLIWMMAS
jgi:hypothetical protein